MERPRKKLTLVHKTNVLTFAGDLWQRTVDSLAKEYPEVSVDYQHVDAASMFFVTQPERFDVIVTDNLFGDILTDLGAAVAGGIGLAADFAPDGKRRVTPPAKRRPTQSGPTAGFWAPGGRRVERVVGPGVLGIAAFHLRLHLLIAAAPEAREIGGDLDRTAGRRQQRQA